MSVDLFIRRVYTYNDISVAVDIDLVKKQISLVQKMGNGSFIKKHWQFTERGREYLGGWVLILEAMKHAITEADKVLQEAEERNQKDFVKQLMALSDNSLDYKQGKKK